MLLFYNKLSLYLHDKTRPVQFRTASAVMKSSYIMKLKSIIILLTGMFILSVFSAACGSEKKKYRIGVSQCSQDDWRAKMNEEIEREAMFHDNCEIEIRSADDSNEKQIEDIRYFADNGFDIVIAAPNEAEPITPVINETMARGIPVVIFDRNVRGDNFTAFQGAANDSIGLQAATYVRTVAPARARVIEIFGNPGSTPAQERHRGFMAGIGDMQLVASAPGNWDYDDALRAADSLLALYPDIDVVFAHNDRMAVAAADAATRHGIDPVIVGIDAAPQIGMKAVAEGKIDATFLYPTEGYGLLRTALAILEGKPYDRITHLPAASAVDASNARILMLQNESLREETSKIQKLKSQVDTYWNRHSIQTTFLYVVLGILSLLFVALFLLIRSYWQKQRQQRLLVEQNEELERQRDNEKQLNEQLNEATQSKLMFFTNVSHDLRTPLTLIAEPVRQLAGAPNLDAGQQAMIRIADRNVRILQRLINQVLDFRKYENGMLGINLAEVDLRHLVGDWTWAFKAVARRRDISLSLECDPNVPAHLAIDVDKMERVFFNLLSNAFKYTPDNGEIRVSVSSADDRLAISVADTGCGIDPADIANIFDRFYQADKVHPNGSGIGLSLAKAFVELHEGTLSVESEPDKGSVFTVSMPVRHVAGEAGDTPVSLTEDDVCAELGAPDRAAETEGADDGDNDDRPLMLVIDDNPDMLSLINNLMGSRYRVITAADGAEGVRRAARYVPDIVVCDVMMPVMDGLECCRRIKSEVSTSHIPVLMLTACSMDEQRVQGYDAGADGYISKPFGGEVLVARCASLIENRRRIRELWQPDVPLSACGVKTTGKAGKETNDTTGMPTATERKAPASRPDLESDFYRRFIDIFTRQMDNPDINVDSIAADMGLGRSQFYRKIKALTNYSPVELMRTLRLREARDRLLKTDMSVSEIAYGTGFSSPAYFTKCYREAFGETPSETRAGLTG